MKENVLVPYRKTTMMGGIWYSLMAWDTKLSAFMKERDIIKALVKSKETTYSFLDPLIQLIWKKRVTIWQSSGWSSVPLVLLRARTWFACPDVIFHNVPWTHQSILHRTIRAIFHKATRIVGILPLNYLNGF